MGKGKLIVIEGSCDGVGKSTQTNLLIENLKNKGINVITHHFPSYGTKQGFMAECLQAGDFGKLSDLSPYLINSIYALDRAITCKEKLKPAYDNGDYIILDRYITSTFFYQSAMFNSLEEKKEYIDYVSDYEYNHLNILKPDLVIFLKIPYELNKKMRDERNKETNKDIDIFEQDDSYLKTVYETSLFVADYLNWTQIDCSKDGKMRSIDDISKEIFTVVGKLD